MLSPPQSSLEREMNPNLTGKVVDAVDPLLVPLEREVGVGLPEGPHLDRAVQGGRGKGVGVLGVENHLHDKVRVALELLGAGPALLPVPELDEGVVRAREDDGEGRVDRNASAGRRRRQGKRETYKYIYPSVRCLLCTDA